MPVEKEYKKCIPKIYKRQYEDIGMFFFVEAQMQIVPAITLCQSIKNYYRFIREEDYDINSSQVTFSRLRAEFIDLNYNKKYENTEKDN